MIIFVIVATIFAAVSFVLSRTEKSPAGKHTASVTLNIWVATIFILTSLIMRG